MAKFAMSLNIDYNHKTSNPRCDTDVKLVQEPEKKSYKQSNLY